MAKPQTRTVPILEAGVRDPGAAGLPAALLGVWTVVPQCVCVLTSASEGTASWDRRLPQSVTPFTLIMSSKALSLNMITYRAAGGRTSRCDFGVGGMQGDTIQPITRPIGVVRRGPLG